MVMTVAVAVMVPASHAATVTGKAGCGDLSTARRPRLRIVRGCVVAVRPASKLASGRPGRSYPDGIPEHRAQRGLELLQRQARVVRVEGRLVELGTELGRAVGRRMQGSGTFAL